MHAKPPSVIVTGAAGFIGSHLCAALLRTGARVTGIDNFDPFYDCALKRANIRRIEQTEAEAPSTSVAAFQLYEADIRRHDLMRDIFERAQPEAVFHLAAMVGVRPSITNPRAYADVNIGGLISVLDAARAVRCRNFIFASSSSVYGNNAMAPFSEDDRVDDPISPYAATKRAGEIIGQAYTRSYGFRIAALRFFTVYGPRQRPDLAIAKFMRLIDAGEDVPMYGDGSTSRDYTYVDDIIDGVLASWNLLQRRCDGTRRDDDGFFRIFNLGSDRPIQLYDLVQRIARKIGKPARILRLPKQIGDAERTWANLSRSRRELAYRPAVHFHDGLARQRRMILEDHDIVNIPVVVASRGSAPVLASGEL